APQPRVGLPDQLAHLAHRHLPHQEQRKGLKLLGEVGAQPLPRWTYPEKVAALAALAARQPAGDLTAVLEDVQMAPREALGMVVAKDRPAVLGAAHQIPEPRRFTDLQTDRARFLLKAALAHFPVQSQAQQLVK